MKKKHFRFLSLAFFLFGILFLLNSKIDITGAVIGASNISSSFGFIFGIVFILLSAVLFISGESLEERISIKNTFIKKRENSYYLIDTVNGKDYSLESIKELSQDRDFNRELRKEYFSDLLMLYANSPEEEKFQYKMFIEALSPNAEKKNLNKRLKQFENVYNSFKDKLVYMNPKRIESAKSSDFNEEVYIRFENERDTFWPEEGSVNFLPFDEVKVNPSRGPLLSIIPLSKLIRDGYLLRDGETLNPKWSPQKRQNYLRDTYGIDVGTRQRNMIYFQLEKDAVVERYGNYENVVVEKEVPLVKVIKKK